MVANSGWQTVVANGRQYRIGSFAHGRVQLIRGWFGNCDSDAILKSVQSLDFKALYHEGKIARFERALSETPLDAHRSIEALAASLLPSPSLSDVVDVERFVFRYSTDHRVPEHQDQPRHLLAVLLYLGTFGGGEVSLQNDDLSWSTVTVRHGDTLLIKNGSADGRINGVNHRVERIKSGERFVVASSFVTSDLPPKKRAS